MKKVNKENREGLFRPGLKSTGELALIRKIRKNMSDSEFSELSSRIIDKNSKKILLIIDQSNIDLLLHINNHPEWGYQINYVITDSEIIKHNYWPTSRVYSLNINLSPLLRYDIVDQIICCINDLSREYENALICLSAQFGISLLLKAPFSFDTPASSYIRIGNKIFTILQNTPINDKHYFIKNFLEKSFVLLFLLSFSWLFVIIGALVKLTSKGPIIFKQLRVGIYGRKFWLYKFRSMEDNAEKRKESLIAYNECDGPMFKITNDPRITKIGKFLRRFNLDELPQFFNVLKGDMALIGPRPMLQKEVDAQKEWQLKRFCVKPGVTGLWQIQPDKNNIPFNKWMKLDKEYVENWTVGRDLILFFKTIWIVITAKGK